MVNEPGISSYGSVLSKYNAIERVQQEDPIVLYWEYNANKAPVYMADQIKELQVTDHIAGCAYILGNGRPTYV
jgi:hypothetical protein